MTSTGSDPLPRLSDALVRVSTTLRDIGDELRTLQLQDQRSAAVQTAPEPVRPAAAHDAPPPAPAPQNPAQGPAFAPGTPTFAPPAPPWSAAPPRPAGPPPYSPFGAGSFPPYPQPYTRPAAPPRPVAQQPFVPVPPRPTLWERLSQEGAGSKLLAWVGGGITLAGVVLLLVLAVQRGYVGPLPRVLLGAGLGAALVAIGLLLNREPSGRIGAHAVAATGFAVLFFDVVAATAIYDFLPAAAGLAAGLAIAAAATAVAARWDSEILAVFAVVGCVVTAPILTDGFGDALLVGFLLTLQIAAAPVHLVKRWRALALVASLPPVGAVLAEVLVARVTDRDAVTVVVLCLLATVVQIAVATAAAVRDAESPVGAGLLLTAPVPTLIGVSLIGPASGAVTVAAVGVVLAVLWTAHRVRLLAVPSTFATAAGAGAAVASFEAACLAFDGDVRITALLGGAVLFAVLAARLRYAEALVPALVFGGIGAELGLAGPLRLDRLARASRVDVPLHQAVTSITAGLLLAAAALSIAWAAGRVLREQDPQATRTRWVIGGLAGLYGATVAVFSVGVAIVPDERGFLIGHVLVTVSWTVGALVLLLRHVDSAPLRVAGLVLVGAAVVKLVLFDLGSLNGIPRVLAFLGAGLVLLAAGARYAALVSDRSRGATR